MFLALFERSADEGTHGSLHERKKYGGASAADPSPPWNGLAKQSSGRWRFRPPGNVPAGATTHPSAGHLPTSRDKSVKGSGLIQVIWQVVGDMEVLLL